MVGAKDREIDIAGIDENRQIVLIGDSKWTQSPLDISDYADMLSDIKIAGSNLPVQESANGILYVMFSKSGFTHRLIDFAASQSPQRLLLVSLEDMYNA